MFLQAQKETALMLCIEHENIELATWLVKSKANLNLIKVCVFFMQLCNKTSQSCACSFHKMWVFVCNQENGDTALVMAVDQSKIELAGYLLEQGANVKAIKVIFHICSFCLMEQKGIYL